MIPLPPWSMREGPWEASDPRFRALCTIRIRENETRAEGAPPASVQLETVRALAVGLSLVAYAAWSVGAPGCQKKSPAPEAVTTPGAEIGIDRARAAYVTDNGSDTITVFDRDGDKVLHVPVDVDPARHEAPHHLAIDSVTGRLFAGLAFPELRASGGDKNDPHASHGNAESHGELVRLDLNRLAVNQAREVDENPGDVVLTHDRSRVLVTHFDMRRAMDVASAGGTTSKMFAALQVWDASAMTLVGSRPLCVAPHGVTTTRDDKTAFVACYGSDELAVVDLSNPSLPTARYPLGASPGAPGLPTYGPYSATLSPDERTVVVASLEGMDVRLFDREAKRFVGDRTVTLAARAFMPAFLDAKTIVVPLQGPDGIVRVDLEAGTITARVGTGETCPAPHVARVAKDGRLYVVCEGDHVNPGAVAQLDPATLMIVKKWTTGVYPDAVGFGDE
jgi:DNA-binding beta-propeller fold protein YncE